MFERELSDAVRDLAKVFERRKADHAMIGGLMDLLRRWPTERFTTFYRGPVRIDWMQPILPIYNSVLKSAKTETWSNAPIRVATAEGLILTKLLSFRPQDLADIETLLIANCDDIDLAMIRQELAPFAATEIERTTWLECAIARLLTPNTGHV